TSQLHLGEIAGLVKTMGISLKRIREQKHNPDTPLSEEFMLMREAHALAQTKAWLERLEKQNGTVFIPRQGEYKGDEARQMILTTFGIPGDPEISDPSRGL